MSLPQGNPPTFLSSERDRAKGEGLSSGADSPTTEATRGIDF